MFSKSIGYLILMQKKAVKDGLYLVLSLDGTWGIRTLAGVKRWFMIS